MIKSRDLTSAYPYVMCAKKFPMSRGERVFITDKKDFEHRLENYCCVFQIGFKKIKPKILQDHYISVSKCVKRINCTVSNGRIVEADYIETIITDIDFSIIKDVYKWDEIEVGNFYQYRRGYLPPEFVDGVLDLYAQKTELKGIEGREEDYALSKEMLNSTYGMCVTNIARDSFIYDDDWKIEKADYFAEIERSNDSKTRFLYYPWGVFITAHCRRIIWDAILALGDDYLYSDTDSVKYRNADKYEDFFEEYNRRIIMELVFALESNQLDKSKAFPKNKKGEVKPLGVFEDEGVLKRFKTLGAKRYLMEHEQKGLILTIAGVHKKKGLEFLTRSFNDVFEAFSNKLFIPAEYEINGREYDTGKKTHTYIDEERRGTISDYNGVVADFHELSAVHLEGADYSLGMDEGFVKFLKKIREIEK